MGRSYIFFLNVDISIDHVYILKQQYSLLMLFQIFQTSKQIQLGFNWKVFRYVGILELKYIRLKWDLVRFVLLLNISLIPIQNYFLNLSTGLKWGDILKIRMMKELLFSWIHTKFLNIQPKVGLGMHVTYVCTKIHFKIVTWSINLILD